MKKIIALALFSAFLEEKPVFTTGTIRLKNWKLRAFFLASAGGFATLSKLKKPSPQPSMSSNESKLRFSPDSQFIPLAIFDSPQNRS